MIRTLAAGLMLASAPTRTMDMIKAEAGHPSH